MFVYNTSNFSIGLPGGVCIPSNHVIEVSDAVCETEGFKMMVESGRIKFSKTPHGLKDEKPEARVSINVSDPEKCVEESNDSPDGDSDETDTVEHEEEVEEPSPEPKEEDEEEKPKKKRGRRKKTRG